MQFRLYILDVSDLQNDNLQQKALLLMDDIRRKKYDTYKTVKDRLHQIAAGLLLQIGLLELETLPCVSGEHDCVWGNQEHKAKGRIFVGTVTEAITALEADIDKICFDVPYQKGQHGKPFWPKQYLESLPFTKKFMEFNLSHSGQYVALLISDTTVGIDIQKKRDVRLEGGCEAFCRMEAYVKCSGVGFAKGYPKESLKAGQVFDTYLEEISMFPDYVLCVSWRLKE